MKGARWCPPGQRWDFNVAQAWNRHPQKAWRHASHPKLRFGDLWVRLKRAKAQVPCVFRCGVMRRICAHDSAHELDRRSHKTLGNGRTIELNNAVPAWLKWLSPLHIVQSLPRCDTVIRKRNNKPLATASPSISCNP